LETESEQNAAFKIAHGMQHCNLEETLHNLEKKCYWHGI